MPTDPQSIFLLALGPISIAAIIGVFVWWLKNREPRNGKHPPES